MDGKSWLACIIHLVTLYLALGYDDVSPSIVSVNTGPARLSCLVYPWLIPFYFTCLVDVR